MKKRILTFLLAALMIFSTATLIACGDQPAETTPTATTTTKPPKGITVPKVPAGTEEDPITIGTAEELKEFAKKTRTNDYEGKVIRLTANIQLNDTSKAGWDTAEDAYVWTMIGNSNTKFKGIFDGAGYAIEGLLIQTTVKGKNDTFGFIHSAWGATVKNVFFYQSALHITAETDFKSAENVIGGGTICGTGKITVSSCVINANISAPKIYNIGTVAGYCAETIIEDCLIVGSISGARVGALTAGAAPLEVKNCVMSMGSGMVVQWTDGASTAEGLYVVLPEGGEPSINTSSANFKVTTVKKADLHGDSAKTACSLLDFANVWNCNDGAFPMPKVFADQMYLFQ